MAENVIVDGIGIFEKTFSELFLTFPTESHQMRLNWMKKEIYCQNIQ